MLHFTELSLRRPGDKEFLIEGMQLSQPFCLTEKQKVAIIGRTGGGKSSLLEAIVALFYLDDGVHLLVSGMPISSLPVDVLRSYFAVFSQVYLFI